MTINELKYYIKTASEWYFNFNICGKMSLIQCYTFVQYGWELILNPLTMNEKLVMDIEYTWMN